MKSRRQKQDEAEIRRQIYNNMTPKEKLQKLDSKLGKNQGATKERAKLHRMIETM